MQKSMDNNKLKEMCLNSYLSTESEEEEKDQVRRTPGTTLEKKKKCWKS